MLARGSSRSHFTRILLLSPHARLCAYGRWSQAELYAVTRRFSQRHCGSYRSHQSIWYFTSELKVRCKRGTKVKGHSNLQVSCTNNGSWPRENMMTDTGKIFKLGTSLKKKGEYNHLEVLLAKLGKIYVVLTSYLNHYGRFKRQTCTQIM